MVLTENELVRKAKERGLSLDKMCPESPDGIHEITWDGKSRAKSQSEFNCIYCGKAIW